MPAVRVFIVLGPETLALPELAPLLGQEVGIVIRRVQTLEEVREMNAGITGTAEQIIADRDER